MMMHEGWFKGVLLYQGFKMFQEFFPALQTATENCLLSRGSRQILVAVLYNG